MQMYREGADGVIDGLHWTFNKCAGGLVAAARWAFNTAVEHTQFVIIMLLLAYIAMSGAIGGTSATARAAPIAHTLDQLTSGSARYELALRLARGLALALCYALAIAAAIAAAHAAIEEQEQRMLKALDGGDSGSPGEPEQHAAVEELERRAHEALNGIDGSDKKPHRRGDAPPQTGVDALPTTRCEIGALLPAGDTPAKLARARRPLAPIGPRDLAAADTVATGVEAEAEVVLAHTHLCRDGAPLEQLYDEFKESVAFTAAVATGGEPINPEQHAPVEEQERRAHEALNGLDGSAKKRHRQDDAPPETGLASSMSPGGVCEISSDKIPFGNTLEPDRLSFATLIATHVLLLKGPTSLVAIAAKTLDSLRALTGVTFEYAASGAASGAYGYNGTGGRPAVGAGSRQWCPTCSYAGTHHIGGADRPCFLDPREPDNVPASVWTNQARVPAMTKGREANARDLGITAGKLIPPSADAIKWYEEYAKDGKGGGKGGGRRGGGRGGGGRGGGAHAGAHVNETTREWLDGLAALTDLTMATIDNTLLMNIKHAVDVAAALEAAADPADTTEDETAVGDEAWQSGIHEINGDGPVDGYSPHKPTVLDYKPTVLDSPHKLFKQSSLRDWLQATKPLEARAVSLQGSANEPEQRAHGDPNGLDGNTYAMAAETGVGQGESLPHASANEPEHRAHAEPNGLEGNASVTAGTEAGIASGFSDAPPETSIEAPPTGRPPDDAAAGALSPGAIKTESEHGLLGPAAASALSAGTITKLESTGRPPNDVAADTLSAGANKPES